MDTFVAVSHHIGVAAPGINQHLEGLIANRDGNIEDGAELGCRDGGCGAGVAYPQGESLGPDKSKPTDSTKELERSHVELRKERKGT